MSKLNQLMPMFTSLLGQLNTNGYVYIGRVNENPITSGVVCYWDKDKTQPAVQPFRTLNGCIVRHGTPAKIYIDTGDYSVSLYDSTRKLVWYSPNNNVQTSEDILHGGYQLSAVVTEMQSQIADINQVLPVSISDSGTFSDLLNLFDGTNNLQKLTPISIGVGKYNMAGKTLKIAGEPLVLNGAPMTAVGILPHTPSIATTSLGGNKYVYSVTIDVADTSNISVGDMIVVKPAGVTLTASNYDETQAGSLHKVLSGLAEVTAKTTTTLTYQLFIKQSTNKMINGDLALALGTVSGGSILKYNTVIQITNAGNGLDLQLGELELNNICIVGTSTGAATMGITLNAGNFKRLKGFNIGVHGFTGPGINIDSALSVADCLNTYVSKCGTHGIRCAGTASTFKSSIISGCGDSVGNGIFATNGANITCTDSVAVGVRNTGFISNRSSIVVAERCFSACNGNYDDEVAGGWSDSEGKGFETEAGSSMFADSSVAIYNTSINFYCLGGSKASYMSCVGSGSLHAHGFYSLLGSTIQARYSVANNNVGRGFYGYGGDIAAFNTLSKDNAVDYVAQGGSTVSAVNYTTTGRYTTTFNPVKNVSGVNQIVTTNAYVIGGRDISVRGDNLQILDGTIAITNSYHIIDSEGATGNDDLTTINGGVDGEMLVLRSLTGLRSITVKTGVGNIILPTNRLLSHYNDKLVLFYDGVAAKWYELSFNDLGG